ncbi:MAG: hypothetical protein AAGH15_22770 [Myxococcota bacterium]
MTLREEKYEDEAGNTLVARERAPGVLHFVATGKLTTPMAERIAAFSDARTTPGLASFHDWWRIGAYDSKARYLLTRWAVENLADLQAAHILTRSRLVKMGVSVANISVGGIGRLHEGSESFEQALHAAMSASRRGRLERLSG